MREQVIEQLEEHIETVENIVFFLDNSKALNELTDPSDFSELARELRQGLNDLRAELEDQDDVELDLN